MKGDELGMLFIPRHFSVFKCLKHMCCAGMLLLVSYVR